MRVVNLTRMLIRCKNTFFVVPVLLLVMCTLPLAATENTVIRVGAYSYRYKQQFVPGSLILNPTSHYLVFRNDTPDQWVAAFEKALGELKNDPYSSFYESLNFWFDLAYVTDVRTNRRLLLLLSLTGIIVLAFLAVRLSIKLVIRSKELKFRSGILESANKMLEELLDERRIHEEKLRESEERFKSLFYKTAEPAALIKNYVFTDCNDALVGYLGYQKKDQIIGKTPWNISPDVQPDGESSEEKARKLFNRTFQSRSTRFEWTHLTSKGEHVLAEVVLTLIAVGSDNIIFVDIRDITESAKAKQELLRQKVFIQTVLDNLPLGVAISIANSGEAFYYNKNFASILDWPPDVLKNRDILLGKLFPDKAFREEFTRNHLKDITTSKDDSLHWKAVKIHTQHHGERHISIGAIPIPEQNIMVITVQDVTPAMMAEIEAKKERDKLRVLLSIARMIGQSVTFEESLRLVVKRICVDAGWDFGEAWIPSEDKTALVFSGAFYQSGPELEGFIEKSKAYRFTSGTGIPGRVWESKEAVWVTDIQTDNNFLRYKEALETGLKTGVGFPVLAKGEVVFVLVFFNKMKLKQDSGLMDLVSGIGLQLGELFRRKTIETDIARTLQMLKDSEERLIQAQRIGNIGSWEFHPDTDIIKATSQAYKIFGLPDGARLTMRKIFSMVVQEYRTMLIQSFRDNMSRGRPFDVVFQIRRFSDKHIRYIYSVAQYDDKNGLLSGIIRDITETRLNERLKQEIIIANESARFKQNFIAQMSHEIRTPLTGIEGMIELLEKTRLDTTQADFVDTIRFSSESLKTIINEVLDYSRLEAGGLNLHPVDFPMAELFERSKKLFQALAKPAYTFRCMGLSALPEFIKADKHRIFQIINNFISNALKYAIPGQITLEITLHKTLRNNHQTFKVMVHDEGPGISAEKKKWLFKPFSQIHKSKEVLIEGTGLGLSICKELSVLLGGEAGVDSEPGKGSIFWFTFKASSVEPETRSQKLQPEANPRAKDSGLQVLLVDDIEVNRKVISLILASLGHHITLAFDGQQAVDVFKPGAFDLILMDIQMPVMDGVAATKKLRELYSALPPVVGLSANAMEGDREKYIDQGLDDYLTKPVRSDDFNHLIQRLGI